MCTEFKKKTPNIHEMLYNTFSLYISCLTKCNIDIFNSYPCSL